MCSINDVDGFCENSVLTEKESFNKDTKCRSCTEIGRIVLRKKDVYCKNCFLSMTTHKFRGALGKSKMMKPHDRVLVAYSGSQSSAALLHLLHSGVTEEKHKRIMFNVFVLFIDEGPLLETTVEERVNMIEKVKSVLSCYDFPTFICSLSESLNESSSEHSFKPFSHPTQKSNEKYERQLVELFRNVKSMSSKEDLLYLLRQKLILRAAEQLNCNKVFTAEVGTGLAMKLIGQFCLGRGDQASFETGFCDTRHSHVKILRPLRDFTRKEVVFYNRFLNVEVINLPALTTKAPSNVSIQKLTEKFVSDLQEEFPSTVYTIFRTGEKLSAGTSGESNNDNLCLLCRDNMRTPKNKNNYTAVEAANFSREVSKKKQNVCGAENKKCCGSCSRGMKDDIDPLELEKFLCYGCTSIVRDMKSLDFLPNDVIQSVATRKNLETMREQISDFLIENASELEV